MVSSADKWSSIATLEVWGDWALGKLKRFQDHEEWRKHPALGHLQQAIRTDLFRAFHPTCHAAINLLADPTSQRRAHTLLRLWRSQFDATDPAQSDPGSFDRGLSLIGPDPQLDVWSSIVPSNPRRWSPSEQRHEIGEYESAICRYSETVERLKIETPGVLTWLQSALRCVVPTKPINKIRRTSSSTPALLGLAMMDLLEEPFIAESLVHEAAHQFFYLTELERPLVMPDAGECYSPLRRSHRPLRDVLLAAHALYFVVLFYDSLPQISKLRCSELDEIEMRVALNDTLACLEAKSRHLHTSGIQLLEALSS